MRKVILGLCALTTAACSSQNTFQVILDYPPAYSNVKKNYKEGELVRIIYAEGGGFMYDARVSVNIEGADAKTYFDEEKQGYCIEFFMPSNDVKISCRIFMS